MCIRDRSRNARRAGRFAIAPGVSRSRRCAAPRERAPTSPGRTAPPSGPAVRRRRSPAGELHVERDLPWRVLEVPEDAGAPPAPEIGPPGATPPDARRNVALAALGITALLAAAVAVFLIIAGPRQGTLVLDGDAARPAGTGARAGSFAPDAALVAGQGLVVDVAGAVLRPGVYLS